MTPLLKFEGVSTAYGHSTILWDLDFAVDPGTATAVIGRNGVGKTTLMRTIMGLQRPTNGTITFEGGDITRRKVYERARIGIGYVPQGRQIFPHLTVQENLETGLSPLTGRTTDERGIPDYIFDLFPKLHQISDRKGGVLSGGEQQQLAIGRALAGRPSLLLLDEPTEGIQPSVVQQIEDALHRIRRELSVTVIIVEQYLDFAWSFADHYLAMQRGQIVRRGRTADEPADTVAHLVNI